MCWLVKNEIHPRFQESIIDRYGYQAPALSTAKSA
jgi:hypothetical protein